MQKTEQKDFINRHTYTMNSPTNREPLTIDNGYIFDDGKLHFHQNIMRYGEMIFTIVINERKSNEMFP